MMRAGWLEARRLRPRGAALARSAILGPTPLQRVQGAPTYYLALSTYYVPRAPRGARAAVRQGRRARTAAGRSLLPPAQVDP
eukprot:scaffold131173_cov66-Phaeocystis_antarctica.AAC.1